MFWKITNITQWSKSLTARLTLIYAVSALFVLSITIFSLYWVYTERLKKENSMFLETKLAVIKQLMSMKSASPSYIQEEMEEEIISEPPLYHYYVRILNQDGSVLIQTPHMENLIQLPKNNFQNNKNHFEKLILLSHHIRHHKNQYFSLMNAVVSDKDKKIIQIAKDISSEQRIIKDYRHIMLITLFIGVLCSSLLGAFITRKGLKPLRNITKSAQRINLSQLNERLNPSAWPKEFMALAYSFNDMLDRIEKGVSRLTQFSADLAHELRTPINNLMGEAEIALSRPRSKQTYREVIESSVEEFQHLSHMIENILFLARSERPETIIHPQHHSCKVIINEIINFYEAAAEEKNIAIYFEGYGDVFADILLLRRVLNNLLNNALRHSHPGSYITITATQTLNGTFIIVKDRGEGIAEHHLPHLFNRFYRVDSARSSKTGGTGLGLAIVKSIIELHHGSVSIQSQLSIGTEVMLFFPANDRHLVKS